MLTQRFVFMFLFLNNYSIVMDVYSHVPTTRRKQFISRGHLGIVLWDNVWSGIVTVLAKNKVNYKKCDQK